MLEAAGRTDDSPRKITATLAYLVDAGRVLKVARGLYAAGA